VCARFIISISALTTSGSVGASAGIFAKTASTSASVSASSPPHGRTSIFTLLTMFALFAILIVCAFQFERLHYISLPLFIKEVSALVNVSTCSSRTAIRLGAACSAFLHPFFKCLIKLSCRLYALLHVRYEMAGAAGCGAQGFLRDSCNKSAILVYNDCAIVVQLWYNCERSGFIVV